ncbi:hypothetical protein [Streptacidiphilus sp. EB103A]|uniref:hypothetical protein n=1 Tax=Streptacidiphilus sp. EB103A TaxID=3156275 RepID=UPI0035177EB3
MQHTLRLWGLSGLADTTGTATAALLSDVIAHWGASSAIGPAAARCLVQRVPGAVALVVRADGLSDHSECSGSACGRGRVAVRRMADEFTVTATAAGSDSTAVFRLRPAA